MLKYLLAFIAFSHFVNGQTLQGRVIDASNQLPLAGAHIAFSFNEQGATTQSDGSFQIDFADSDTLIISFVGYMTRKIVVSEPGQFLHVTMQLEDNILSEVVVAAYGLDSRAMDIPASVGVIKRADLFRGDGATIVPAMNRIPGVFMQSGAYNTNRLTIRGIGSRSPFATSKIRAYFKSIPLTTGDGETTIEDTDIDLLSRVEVLRGPSSSMYGAGLGGTVLLQSREADHAIKTSMTVGSYGLVKSNTSVAINAPKSSWGGEYNYLHSDGYRENNEYDRQTATIAGNIFLGDNSTLSILATGIDLYAFIPSSIDSATFASDPRSAAPSWAATEGYEDTRKYLTGVDFQHYFPSDITLNVSLFSTGADSYELRPFNILDVANNTIGSRGISALVKEKYRASLGYEYFRESYKWQTYQNNGGSQGNIIADNKEIRQYINAFTQFEYMFSPRIAAIIGLNVNKTGYELNDLFQPDSINQSGTYEFNPIVSPRVVFQYKLEKGQLYATISQGFSPPSFDETLAPDGLINPDLKPEMGTNYEIGYKGILGNLSMEMALYTMQINDLLVSRRLMDDQTIGINAGKTAHNGLEMQAQYVWQTNAATWTPFIGLTLADYTFVDFVDGSNDYSGNKLTGVPNYIFNLGLDWKHRAGWYGNVNYQAVGEMPITDDNSIYTSSYGIANVKVGFAKQLGRWHVDINAGVNNIFDTTYASMIQINAPSFGSPPRYYYPGLPTNYFVGLGVKYRFKDG